MVFSFLGLSLVSDGGQPMVECEFRGLAPVEKEEGI